MSMSSSLDDWERWVSKACANAAKWGDQNINDLILAIVEEVGELSQAFLQHRYEDQPKERIWEELDDLAPLIIQLRSLYYHHYLDTLPVPRPCAECNATGEDPEGNECIICDGTGTITIDY